jgi:hypothetical protein
LKVTGTLNGGKITGATIIGASIANAETNPTFSVDSKGNLIAATANIGGWQVKDSSSGFSNGSFYMHPEDGLNFNDNFCVDKNGYITANGAKLNELEVYKSLIVSASATATAAEVAVADAPGAITDALATINGNTKIAGNTEITGNLKVNANLSIGMGKSFYLNGGSSSADGHIYFGNNYLYINASSMKLGPVSDKGTVQVNGTMEADDVYFKGKIYTKEGTNTKKGGVDGSIYYAAGGFWGGKIKEAKFINGILVDADTSSSSDSGDVSTMLPSLTGHGGEFLRVNTTASDTEWKPLYAPLTKGTSGQFWGSNGDSSNPAWKTVYPPTTKGTAT